MSVRSIEIMDNTTPGTLTLDVFDMDTIQRAEQFRPMDVLFVSDVRVSWRGGTRLQMCGKSVLTHQPHTPEAEALRLYISNQANTRGGAPGWSGWGERAVPATVRQTRDRLATGGMFCAELHALLTHLDLDELLPSTDNTLEEFRIRLADHTGEVTAVLPINVLENVTGYSVAQIKNMNDEHKTGLRWMFMLEHCYCNISVTPPRVVVLALRKAIANDPIPLY
ncbi:unnamed protein product [Danaus chrysippus]|uniref:(African queen) hypothetical protein n=1 Tax=Danaus chrysippus TaxID=151541 RepID=A0A8J2QEL5_9NEOP|nr:unnamed protein product [Danaus chrysippus]